MHINSIHFHSQGFVKTFKDNCWATTDYNCSYAYTECSLPLYQLPIFLNTFKEHRFRVHSLAEGLAFIFSSASLLKILESTFVGSLTPFFQILSREFPLSMTEH
jgi:hypothetical protein